MIIRLVMTVVFLLCLSCRGSEPNGLTPAQLERMTRVREELKQKLGNAYTKPVSAATSDQLMRGQELYQQVCAPCHGVRGQGDGHTAQGLIGNPTDLTDAEQANFYSEQARLQIIRKGVSGTPMMGWDKVLTEEDILSVYLYTRSLIKSK